MANTRDYKAFAEGEWYHVYARGNNKMDIFCDDQDYSIFVDRLARVLGREGVQGAPLHSDGRRVQVRISAFDKDAFSIAAWVLMPNHFHFLIRQNTSAPISNLFLKLLTSYSMYFNRKHQHVGHVFQDRFRAVRIQSDKQLLHTSAYIHSNPCVAELTRKRGDWWWGSYREYTQGVKGFSDIAVILDYFKDASEYDHFVGDAEADIRRRKATEKELLKELQELGW